MERNAPEPVPLRKLLEAISVLNDYRVVALSSGELNVLIAISSELELLVEADSERVRSVVAGGFDVVLLQGRDGSIDVQQE
jgi:hypothetical protein